MTWNGLKNNVEIYDSYLIFNMFRNDMCQHIKLKKKWSGLEIEKIGSKKLLTHRISVFVS